MPLVFAIKVRDQCKAGSHIIGNCVVKVLQTLKTPLHFAVYNNSLVQRSPLS